MYAYMPPTSQVEPVARMTMRTMIGLLDSLAAEVRCVRISSKFFIFL